MKIETELKDDYAVVSIEGRVTRENQADLRTRLEELLDSGARNIAMDLAGVDYMDSAALGCCAAVQKLMRNEDKGLLVVFGASENIAKMWRLIRLDLVVPIEMDREGAVARFSA